jgi:hypothetical protein
VRENGLSSRSPVKPEGVWARIVLEIVINHNDTPYWGEGEGPVMGKFSRICKHVEVFHIDLSQLYPQLRTVQDFKVAKFSAPSRQKSAE